MNPKTTERVPDATGFVGLRMPAHYDRDRAALAESLCRDFLPELADALIEKSAPSATIEVVFEHSHPTSFGSFWKATIDGKPVAIKEEPSSN